MRIIIKVLLISLLLMSCSQLSGEKYYLERIIDGDTIVVNPGQQIIRFYGIDCPEADQPYGDIAEQYLTTILPYKMYITVSGTDQYCKEPYFTDWKISEENAINQKQGLWSEADPVPPWEWRKNHE